MSKTTWFRVEWVYEKYGHEGTKVFRFEGRDEALTKAKALKLAHPSDRIIVSYHTVETIFPE